MISNTHVIHDPPTSTLCTLHMDLGLEPADLKDSLSWVILIRMLLFLSLPSPVPAHEWPALCHWEYGALSLEDPQCRWRGKVSPFIRLHEASKYSATRQIVFFSSLRFLGLVIFLFPITLWSATEPLRLVLEYCGISAEPRSIAVPYYPHFLVAPLAHCATLGFLFSPVRIFFGFFFFFFSASYRYLFRSLLQP